MSMGWTKANQDPEGEALLPDSAEIVCACWYVHDEDGLIYSLRAQLYIATGTESDKRAFLESRAYRDYLVARVFSIPERFHLQVLEPGGSKVTQPIAHLEALVSSGGLDQLFFEALTALNQDLPAQTRLEIPESPLLLIRALTVDAAGDVVPTDSLRYS
jgi:hypothetical protein